LILLAIIFVLCLVAAGYQITAIRACLGHLTRTDPWATAKPGVSILKPIRGADAGFLEAIRTHARIDYPNFEILFGLADPADPARPLIEQVQLEFPHVAIRIVECTTVAPNAKVATLEDLAAAARNEMLVINDSDISVPHDYLYRLATSLAAPGTGLVTCLYRASAETFPARLEALGIATDFAPSALVAPFVGVKEFGLGSTLALRAETVVRIGGFAAIRDYIADDYQIGKRVSALGLNVELSRMVVSTHLEGTWSEVWNHQVRWARTIRVSRSGYFGLPVTNATLWSLVALIAGHAWMAVGLLALRLATGLIAGRLVLRDSQSLRFWWLMPVRDLFGLAVWVAGCFGSTVIWRGQRLRVMPDGRMRRVEEA
jgi:ceramide glucosyltransferase